MATRTKLIWHGARVKRKVRARLAINLDIAAEFMTNFIKVSLSIGSPPRSAPGKEPHTDMGLLINNINWERKGRFVRRIGTGVGGGSSVGYAFWLEWGTMHMAARPFLRPALRNRSNQLTITKIVARNLL